MCIRDSHGGIVIISASPFIPFRDPFDQLLVEQGPPAVFTVDSEGELQLDPMRTRDCWSRLPPAARPDHGLCHCLFRDRATGYVQYILVTSPALCETHPRADIRRYADQKAALDVLTSLGSPPILHTAL